MFFDYIAFSFSKDRDGFGDDVDMWRNLQADTVFTIWQGTGNGGITFYSGR